MRAGACDDGARGPHGWTEDPHALQAHRHEGPRARHLILLAGKRQQTVKGTVEITRREHEAARPYDSCRIEQHMKPTVASGPHLANAAEGRAIVEPDAPGAAIEIRGRNPARIIRHWRHIGRNRPIARKHRHPAPHVHLPRIVRQARAACDLACGRFGIEARAHVHRLSRQHERAHDVEIAKLNLLLPKPSLSRGEHHVDESCRGHPRLARHAMVT